MSTAESGVLERDDVASILVIGAVVAAMAWLTTGTAGETRVVSTVLATVGGLVTATIGLVLANRVRGGS